MADAPEIPEASDPFDKRVAVTIAIIAVILAFIENAGNNGTSQSIIKTTEASNQWAYYQSKSIKESLVSFEKELLTRLATTDQKDRIDRLKSEIDRYEGEKAEIKASAQKLEQEAKEGAAIDDRADLASLFLQVAIVVCSVSILAKSNAMWVSGVALALVGVGFGLTLGAALLPW